MHRFATGEHTIVPRVSLSKELPGRGTASAATLRREGTGSSVGNSVPCGSYSSQRGRNKHLREHCSGQTRKRRWPASRGGRPSNRKNKASLAQQPGPSPTCVQRRIPVPGRAWAMPLHFIALSARIVYWAGSDDRYTAPSGSRPVYIPATLAGLKNTYGHCAFSRKSA